MCKSLSSVFDTLIWDDTAWVRGGRGERKEWGRRKDGEEKEESYWEVGVGVSAKPLQRVSPQVAAVLKSTVLQATSSRC